MALTSLLWISISLWPARKREDEQGSEEVRRNEYERERKRGEGGGSSLELPLDLGAAAGRTDRRT